MNTWDTCKNCGGERGLHHYETDQCPVGGREAPIGRKQEWKTTTFEIDNSGSDSRISDLEAQVTEYKAEQVITAEALRANAAEITKLKKEIARLQCPHERGTITNYHLYPATREQPAEETGTVNCDKCGETWELGYQPEEMGLEIER